MLKDNLVTIIIVFAFGIFVFLGGFFLKSQQDNTGSRPTQLTISGEGKAKAPPELVQFTVSFVAGGTTAEEATNNEKTMRQTIITLLTDQYGVATSDIQASYPRIVPVTGTTNTTVTYQAVNTLDVNFKNLKILDEAVNKFYKLGNLTISNVVFTTANARDLEDQANNLAYSDAKMRAEKMAQAAGKRLGKLVAVSGTQMQAVGTVSSDVSIQKGPQGFITGTVPGQIQIIRNVTLVYELL